MTDDLPLAAAKIGLVPTPAVAEALAARLGRGALPNLVLDPVLVAGSGDALGAAGTAAALRALLPHATLVTPNLAEAAALTGHPVRDVDEMIAAGRELVALGSAAALGEGRPPARPTRRRARHPGRCPSARRHARRGRARMAPAARCPPPSPRVSAAAIDLLPAVERAVAYVRAGLAAAPALGGGARPLDHRVPTH